MRMKLRGRRIKGTSKKKSTWTSWTCHEVLFVERERESQEPERESKGKQQQIKQRMRQRKEHSFSRNNKQTTSSSLKSNSERESTEATTTDDTKIQSKSILLEFKGKEEEEGDDKTWIDCRFLLPLHSLLFILHLFFHSFSFPEMLFFLSRRRLTQESKIMIITGREKRDWTLDCLRWSTSCSILLTSLSFHHLNYMNSLRILDFVTKRSKLCESCSFQVPSFPGWCWWCREREKIDVFVVALRWCSCWCSHWYLSTSLEKG